MLEKALLIKKSYNGESFLQENHFLPLLLKLFKVFQLPIISGMEFVIMMLRTNPKMSVLHRPAYVSFLNFIVVKFTRSVSISALMNNMIKL